ncbi:MAG: UbiX family flavin prenyltransferase [Trueperaceae bacterium]|nr:UbiX family flavin prenyltransferase [Trueperaceae bacterium]
MAKVPHRVVVAVSGGSGMPYAVDLLEALTRVAGVETHLVVTAGAKLVWPTEIDLALADLLALADVVHKDGDLGASIASGSFRAHGMVVVPCSAGTLAKVAQGLTDNLVARAAHVCLKERRPLVLTVREAPYPRPMLLNMLAAHDAGATVLPASPGFYHRPGSVAELVAGITARTLDLLGLEHRHAPRWRDDD